MEQENFKKEFSLISEMCNYFNVTPRTLRYYESKELLFPKRVGKKRLFSKSDQARLKLILKGKRFGFSLEEIRKLLNLYQINDKQITQLGQTFKMAKKRLNMMKEERKELDNKIDDLKNNLIIVKKLLEAKGIDINKLKGINSL